MAVEHVFNSHVVWQCEYDTAAAKVLAHRYPNIPNCGDVTAINWDSLDRVDILCGGYPCQPFSAAGQRKGTEDERHLWPYFAEAIRRIRPRYVVLENVAGHRSMGFDTVLGDLASVGYDAQWCSVRASDVGAPHRRERVFVLATPSDASDATADRQRSRTQLGQGSADAADANLWSVAARIGRGELLLPTPSAADGDGGHLTRSGERGDELLLPGVARAYGNGELLPTPNAQDGNGGGRYNSAGHQSTLPGTVRLLPTPRKSDGDGGPNPLHRSERMDDVETRIIRCAGQWGKYAPAIAHWEAVTRPAPTPTEPNRNGNPRLAPAFSEWMMGWPAGWVTEVPGISRNDQLRIIGNGVVPQQAAAALRWLLSVEVAA